MTAPNKGTDEPVAWMVCDDDGSFCTAEPSRDAAEHARCVYVARSGNASRWHLKPLYTRAPAQDAAVAELIEEQLFAAIEHGDADHRAWLRGKMRDFFAAIAANKATPT